MSFGHAHIALLSLPLRELEFLVGIGQIRVEYLRQLEEFPEQDQAEAELSLAA